MTINAISADGVAHDFPDGTDPAVIGRVMKTYAASQTAAGHPSYISDVVGGVHDLGTSVSQGAQAVGGIMARNGMPEWGGAVQDAGKFVANHTPDAPAGPSPTSDVASAIKSGDYGAALSQLPHAALRATIGAAPVLAAGALTGPIGAGVMAGAQSLGPLAYARAQNNNRAEPTTSDVVGAIPGAVGEGAGGALLPGASKALGPLARAGVNVAKDAAAGAIMDTSGQLGGSVGTDKGAQFDPAQTAANAATMGTMGAARSLPAVGRATVGNLSDNIMSRTAVDQPSSPEQAASQARVGELYQQAQARNPNNTPIQTLNSLKTQTSQSTLALMREAAAVGLLSADTLSMGKKVLIDQALRHNNSIDSADDGGTATLYDEVANSGVDPKVLQPILQGIQDTNTLSPSSFLKNQTGPFRAIGGGIGKVADAASLIGLAGHPISKMAGGIGGIMDSAMGTATPKVLLQAIAARRALAGASPGPNTLQSIADARANVASMPAPPGPPGPAPAMRPQIMNPPQQAPAPAPTPGFIRPQASMPQAAPEGGPIPPFIRPKPAMPAPQPGQPDPTTGLPNSPIPPNVPIRPTGGAGLPPLAVDTPASVSAALQQADLLMGKAPGAPQAAPQAPQAPARSAASSFIGRPLGASHDEVMAAARGTPAEDLVANGGATPIHPTVAAPIQQAILAARGQQAMANIQNPIAYAKAAQSYMTMSENVAQQLAAGGKTDAANAVRQIAHNLHSKAAKQAARAALPADVAALIPDAIVNHGGQ